MNEQMFLLPSFTIYAHTTFTWSITTSIPSPLTLSFIFLHRLLSTTYLCRQAPCQSSCHLSGRHGALNPRRGNNLADRCTPGCIHRRAGLDPQRQHLLGFLAACRNALEIKQRADKQISINSHTSAYRVLHGAKYT